MLKVLKGGGMPTDKQKEKRRKLLAIVHIAKKQLGLSDDEYEAALNGVAGSTGGGWIASAAALIDDELIDLIQHFESMGFKSTSRRRPSKRRMADALRDRIILISEQIPDGRARLNGLTRKRAGVEMIEWVRDVPTLKAILAAINGIHKRERSNTHGNR